MGQYYSSLKILSYPDKLEALKRGELTAPIHIRLKPTNSCNHACWYCGYQNQDAAISLGEQVSKRDRIPSEKMLEICNDIVTMGVRAVTFSGGGEPLTYPAIQKYVQLLTDGGVQVALLTNGALLDGERAAAFADRAAWVRVSMDGWDDESYQRYRGVRGREYSKIVANLQSFTAVKGKTVLGIALNIDIDNAAHCYDFIRTMKDLGVDNIKLSGCIVSNDAAENDRYHEPVFAKTVASIERAKHDFEDSAFQVINCYHKMERRFDKDFTSCPFAQCLTVIAADQNVYLCQDKAYTESGKIGSLAGRSFRELWSDPQTHGFLKQLNPVCDCRHHCVAEEKNRMLLELRNLDPGHVAFV